MESGTPQSQDTFELPKPTQGMEAPSHETGERVFTNIETQSELPQASPGQPPADISSAADAASAVQVTKGAPMAAQTVQNTVSDPHVTADDVDLIEKEWVDKAKAIVEQTKNDPYLQNREMSKVKARYIENRWRKKIKLADDAPQA